MSRADVRGNVQALALVAARCREAVREAVADPDVILTPADMKLVNKSLKEATIYTNDVKKVLRKFGEVADVREAMIVLPTR